MPKAANGSFNENISNLAELWPDYKLGKKTDKNNPVHDLVLNRIPEILKSWAPDTNEYIFKGSEGEGNLTKTPWFAVLNPEITDTARKGYYIVYLFDENFTKLFLAIGFGVRQFENRYGGGKKLYPALESAVENMRVNSSYLLNQMVAGTLSRTKQNSISLTQTGDKRLSEYEKCAIYGLSYDLSNLPDELSIKSDFLEYLNLYQNMSDSLLIADDDAYVLESINSKPKITEISEIEFVPRPPRKPRNSKTNSVTSQRRYSKKSDKIGRIGEEWVFEYEKRKLIKSGHKDLSERVIWHRHYAENRTPGWDITSFSDDGNYKYIEVKSSTGQAINEIILTSKEWQKACDSELAKSYYIYLLSDVPERPSLEIMRNPFSYVEMKKIEISVDSYSLNLHTPTVRF
jgi:hypothetical protein